MTPEQQLLTTQIRRLERQLLQTYIPADPFLALKGREQVKRALIVAAVGRCTCLIVGPRRGIDGVKPCADALGLTADMLQKCRCGNYGDPELHCACSASRIRARLERMDLSPYDMVIDCYPPSTRDLMTERPGTTLAEVQARLDRTGRFQAEHPEADNIMDGPCLDLWRRWLTEFHPGSEEVAKTHRVVRAIADLGNDLTINPCHVVEAMQYSPSVNWARI